VVNEPCDLGIGKRRFIAKTLVAAVYAVGSGGLLDVRYTLSCDRLLSLA